MIHGQRRWWQRPSRLVPVGTLVLLLVGLVGFKVASRSGLKREMEAIRAKGLPTNPKELDEWYAKVPMEENAGLKILEAHSEFVAAGDGRDPGEISWSEIPHDASLDATTVAILRIHSERNAKTLRLLREASKLKRSRYSMDLSRAPDLNFSHLVPAKNLAQLARWEAVYQAERGDAASSLEGLRSGFAVCHTLAQEPLLISELVRLACLNIQMVGLERVINVARFDQAQLHELSGILREAVEDSRRAVNRAFIGERAFANTGRKYSFEEYEQMIGVGAWVGAVTGGGVPTGNSTSEWPEILRKAFYYGRRGIGMHDRDHAFFMRSMGRLIEATGQDHPQFLVEAEKVTADLEAEMSAHPLALELSRISLASMFYVPRKEVMAVARLHCALMAVEIEAWRKRNGGQLPSDEELVSDMKIYPVDPMDGSPLKYQRAEAKGYKMIARAASDRNRADSPNARDPVIDFEVVK